MNSPYSSQAAPLVLQVIYRPGNRYAKAGVMRLDLRPIVLIQQELALDDDVADPGEILWMQALDAVNQRFGGGAVAMADAELAGVSRGHRMKQERPTLG